MKKAKKSCCRWSMRKKEEGIHSPWPLKNKFYASQDTPNEITAAAATTTARKLQGEILD